MEVIQRVNELSDTLHILETFWQNPSVLFTSFLSKFRREAPKSAHGLTFELFSTVIVQTISKLQSLFGKNSNLTLREFLEVKDDIKDCDLDSEIGILYAEFNSILTSLEIKFSMMR